MVAQTVLPALCRCLVLTALAAWGAGCTCSRVRINEGIEQLDSAWIIPGQTTFEEVITRLGLPPPAGKVDDVALYLSDDLLHWVSTDTFTAKLELGYLLTPLFERSRTVVAHDLMICFDERRVVSRLSRTAREGQRVRLLEYREATP
ncbi:MAG: hypothetical protein ACI4RT_04930 [Candidatus Spyradenecus sp.]